MPLPTAEEITNLYLYGQRTAPATTDIRDEKWIRPKTTAANIVRTSVDVNDYMGTTGPGRFASASALKPLQEFFNPAINPKSQALTQGTYTKTALFQALGYLDASGAPVTGTHRGASLAPVRSMPR